MSTYCVAMRIADKTVNGKTYADRRQSVIDNIYSDNGYWDELTSFFLVTSSLNTGAFAKKASSGLSAPDDLLIAFDPSDMSVGYFGNFKHVAVMSSFFKSAQKV